MSITVSRLGQVNASGSTQALFLSIFAGEVMSVFNTTNIMMPLQRVRDIDHGKSADFPVVGKAVSSYHVPGNDIDGQTINTAQATVFIDDLLIAPVFIAKIDEAKLHFDLRQPYTTALGRAMALAFDKRAIQTAILAARANTFVTGGDNGSSQTHAGANTDAEVLKNAIISAGQKLDEKNVPEEDRFGIFRPAQHALLVQDTDTMNRDWGGSGSLASGKVYEIGGVTLKKSNNIPSGVISGVSGENNTYSGTFTNTTGVVMNKEAIGTVRLLNLAVETEYTVRLQGTLVVAKYALGTGILRPECAYEIKNA